MFCHLVAFIMTLEHVSQSYTHDSKSPNQEESNLVPSGS